MPDCTCRLWRPGYEKVTEYPQVSGFTSTCRPTHAIVATIRVPDGGTKEDVQAALDAVDSEID
jgi:hypothetical protein